MSGHETTSTFEVFQISKLNKYPLRLLLLYTSNKILHARFCISNAFPQNLHLFLHLQFLILPELVCNSPVFQWLQPHNLQKSLGFQWIQAYDLPKQNLQFSSGFLVISVAGGIETGCLQC